MEIYRQSQNYLYRRDTHKNRTALIQIHHFLATAGANYRTCISYALYLILISLSDTTDTETDTDTNTETDSSQQKTGDSGGWKPNIYFHKIQNAHMCKIPSIKDFPLSAADENNEKPSAEDSRGMRNHRNMNNQTDCIMRWSIEICCIIFQMQITLIRIQKKRNLQVNWIKTCIC